MDLGCLVEQIDKCMTGSVPEKLEGSPQISQVDVGKAGKGCCMHLLTIFYVTLSTFSGHVVQKSLSMIGFIFSSCQRRGKS